MNAKELYLTLEELRTGQISTDAAFRQIMIWSSKSVEMEKAIKEIAETLDGLGTPNMEWVKATLLKSIN